MITGINESKTSTKHMSCKCKCKFDGTKCNSNQWWNNDKSQCECKKHSVCEKDSVWNPATYNCENGKYLASIMELYEIICDDVEETNFNKKHNFLYFTIFSKFLHYISLFINYNYIIDSC